MVFTIFRHNPFMHPTRINIKLQKRIYPIIIENIPLLIFASAGLIAILNHSMWRDELNVWMVARDSYSLTELYQNVIPEGHPILWYLILFYLKSIINTPIAMQILHWLLGTLSIFLFYNFSPFTRLQKILFCFGYFPFYEYFIISRNYVIVEFFLFLFCSIYSLRRKTYIPIMLSLGVLANSHAYAFLISISLGSMLVSEWLWSRQQRKSYCQGFWFLDLIISCTIFILCIGFAAHMLILAGDPTKSSLFSIDIRRIFESLGSILGGYTFIVPSSKHWLDLVIGGIAAIGLCIFFMIFLRKEPLISVFYITNTLLLCLFFYLLHFGGGSRHQGFFYLILVVAMWLAMESPHKIELDLKAKPWFDSFTPHLFTFILIIHFATGLVLFTNHLFIPFSASRATVEYLRQEKIIDEFIVASPDTSMAPIAGYLNKSLYYPEIKKQGTFTHWRSRVEVSKASIFQQIQNLLIENHSLSAPKRILLILNSPLESSEIQSFGPEFHLLIKSIAHFDKSWHSSEHYYLYWVERVHH